jgi:hypothetical protein
LTLLHKSTSDVLYVSVASLPCCIETSLTYCTPLSVKPVQKQNPQSKFPQLSFRFLSSISTRPATTPTFAINCVIVVAMCHTLCAIYWNCNESSGGTSACNGGVLLAASLVTLEGYYCRHLWLQWRYITGGTSGCNGGILPAAHLVALEGYYCRHLWLQ